jgi:hypothetical protein
VTDDLPVASARREGKLLQETLWHHPENQPAVGLGTRAFMLALLYQPKVQHLSHQRRKYLRLHSETISESYNFALNYRRSTQPHLILALGFVIKTV